MAALKATTTFKQRNLANPFISHHPLKFANSMSYSSQLGHTRSTFIGRVHCCCCYSSSSSSSSSSSLTSQCFYSSAYFPSLRWVGFRFLAKFGRVPLFLLFYTKPVFPFFSFVFSLHSTNLLSLSLSLSLHYHRKTC